MEYFYAGLFWYASGLLGAGIIDYLDRSHKIYDMSFFSGLIISLFGWITLVFSIVCFIFNNLTQEIK